MGIIKHFKSSEHSPETKSAVKFQDNYTLTTFDRELEYDTGTCRLLPVVFIIEKGKPYTFTAYGTSACYVIEGEYVVEDLSAPGKPIYLTKGDVSIAEEGTIVKCSSPSKARVFAATYLEAPQVITDTLS